MFKGSYFTHEYREFHAYVDSIRKVNVRFTLTRLNRALWTLSGAVLPGGVVIQSVWGGSSAVVQARTPAAGSNILIHHQGQFVGMGEEMKPGSALLMPPGSMALTHTPGGYGCYSIFIPTGLAQSVDSLRFLIDRERPDAHVARSDPQASGSAGQQLGDFFSLFNSARGDFSKYGSLVDFRDELVDAIGSTYGCRDIVSKSKRGRPLRANEHALGRALDSAEKQKLKNTKMSDLASAANVSESRLRTAFHRYLGLSPSEYVRLRRFNLIWQELNDSRATDITVARILTEYRIEDMGRFARRYRHIFGENPSETLNRDTQSASG